MPSELAVELLSLLNWPGVGVAKVRKVLERGGDAVLEAAEQLYPGIDAAARSAAATKAEEQLARCDELGIHVVALPASPYPALLRRVDDAPPLLFVRGDPRTLSCRSVAVVGTRNASVSGRRITDVLVHAACAHGLGIVSGLALGIDAAAHRAALDAGGTSIAVLAHGLDTVTPARNRDLADDILASGGALVSEHPPGVPARRHEYVRRNRLQSGLSVASVIVESGVEGGAMHEARFAVGQGRRLLTVLPAGPETAGDLDTSGAEQLIAEHGATPVRSTGDLLRILEDLDGSGLGDAAPGQGRFGW